MNKLKKVAIVITAYKDLLNLQFLLDYFSDFSVYLHFDTSNLSKSEISNLNILINESKITYYSNKYKIAWGSPNHLFAIIELLTEVSKNECIEFIHIISGQDFPIKSKEEIYKFSIDNKEQLYIGYDNFLDIDDFDTKQRLYSPILFKHSNFKSKKYKLLRFIELYRIIYPRKKWGNYSKEMIYKGLIWSSFSAEFNQYLLKQALTDNLKKDISNTLIAEEFFLQTIALNSEFKNKVNNDDKRYVLWKEKNGSIPAILDDSDFENIISSNKLFARKIDSKISESLKSKLIKEINSNIG